jgi:AbrB family looped-hinge helix DNA binding protein
MKEKRCGMVVFQSVLALDANRAQHGPIYKPVQDRFPMTRIKVHYDGWISLPATVRRKFRLATGDELELVATTDGILLRAGKPLAGIAASEPEEEAQPEPAAVVAAPAAAPAEEPAEEKRAGKRSKRAVPPRASLPSQLQARGRRGAGKATAG